MWITRGFLPTEPSTFRSKRQRWMRTASSKIASSSNPEHSRDYEDESLFVLQISNWVGLFQHPHLPTQRQAVGSTLVLEIITQMIIWNFIISMYLRVLLQRSLETFHFLWIGRFRQSRYQKTHTNCEDHKVASRSHFL